MLYAIALCALVYRDGVYTTSISTGATVRDSKQDAIADGIQMALDVYPVAAGYTGHACVVEALPNEMLRLALRDTAPLES